MPCKVKVNGHFEVIVADREPKVRSALQFLCEDRKIVGMLTEAADSNQVIACVAKSCPDLLLIDWCLPGQATGSLLPIIKMICPNLHIIVLSEHEDDCAEALLAGANAYICKYDPPDLLLAIVDDLLLSKQDLPQEEMVLP